MLPVTGGRDVLTGTFCIDDGDGLAYGNHFSFLRQDLPQDATLNRWHFCVYFVGGYLEQRLVLFDRVAGILQPVKNRGFCDAFTHFRHYQFYKGHSVLITNREL